MLSFVICTVNKIKEIRFRRYLKVARVVLKYKIYGTRTFIIEASEDAE